jgi:hypothetical protein
MAGFGRSKSSSQCVWVTSRRPALRCQSPRARCSGLISECRVATAGFGTAQTQRFPVQTRWAS